MTTTNARSAMAWTRLISSAIILSTAGMASAAWAQNADAQPRDIQGDFDRPLGEVGDDESGFTTNTTLKFTQIQNGTNYTLLIENGKKSATINGQRLPKDQVREVGKTVEILDPAGNVLTTFNVGDVSIEPRFPNNGRNIQIERGRRGAGELNRFDLAPLPGIDQPAPPVMLGITMSAQDGGVVVDRVVPGLPAEKAGLKEGDLILKFDDKPVTTPEALRAALMDKKAGSQIVIRVKRADKELDLKAQLTAFDAQELGVNDQAAMVVRPFMDHAEQSMEEAKRAVEEALEKIKAIDTEKVRKDVEEALHKALASVEAAQAGAREQGQRWVDMLNRGPGMRMLMGDGEQPQMFVMPDGADNQQLRDMIQEQLRMFQRQQPNQHMLEESVKHIERSEESTRAMDRMSDQMERMMDRLERLEQRLNEAEKK